MIRRMPQQDWSADTSPTATPLAESVAAGLLDLTWLRRCPLLAALRSDPRFIAGERAVAAATAPILAAYHAGAT